MGREALLFVGEGFKLVVVVIVSSLSGGHELDRSNHVLKRHHVNAFVDVEHA